jgi:hypothetical protein
MLSFCFHREVINSLSPHTQCPEFGFIGLAVDTGNVPLFSLVQSPEVAQGTTYLPKVSVMPCSQDHSHSAVSERSLDMGPWKSTADSGSRQLLSHQARTGELGFDKWEASHSMLSFRTGGQLFT